MALYLVVSFVPEFIAYVLYDLGKEAFYVALQLAPYVWTVSKNTALFVVLLPVAVAFALVDLVTDLAQWGVRRVCRLFSR